MAIALVLVIAVVAVLGLVAFLARAHTSDPVLAMAFAFLLVLAGGFLVVGTEAGPAVVGFVLLAAGVVTGAVALRGSRVLSEPSPVD